MSASYWRIIQGYQKMIVSQFVVGAWFRCQNRFRIGQTVSLNTPPHYFQNGRDPKNNTGLSSQKKPSSVDVTMRRSQLTRLNFNRKKKSNNNEPRFLLLT